MLEELGIGCLVFEASGIGCLVLEASGIGYWVLETSSLLCLGRQLLGFGDIRCWVLAVGEIRC